MKTSYHLSRGVIAIIRPPVRLHNSLRRLEEVAFGRGDPSYQRCKNGP